MSPGVKKLTGRKDITKWKLIIYFSLWFYLKFRVVYRCMPASVPELDTVQQFLRGCHKHCFISYAADIYDLLEKTDSPGGGTPHMKGMGMLIGHFELNP